MEVRRYFEVKEHGGIDPDKESPRFFAKHFSAYDFISRFAGGRALEIGFGDGYGSHWMADRSSEMIGIDLFQKNVDQANAKYQHPRLRFLRMDALDLRFEHPFDLVFSFQVIEHIPEMKLGVYLTQIKSAMKDASIACISTLNLKKNKKPGQAYDKSPDHDKEFEPEELQALLRSYFASVDLYGLYPTAKHRFFEILKKSGITKALPKKLDPVKGFFDHVRVYDFEWRPEKNLDGCIDLLAVCRK